MTKYCTRKLDSYPIGEANDSEESKIITNKLNEPSLFSVTIPCSKFKKRTKEENKKFVQQKDCFNCQNKVIRGKGKPI